MFNISTFSTFQHSTFTPICLPRWNVSLRECWNVEMLKMLKMLKCWMLNVEFWATIKNLYMSLSTFQHFNISRFQHFNISTIFNIFNISTFQRWRHQIWLPIRGWASCANNVCDHSHPHAHWDVDAATMANHGAKTLGMPIIAHTLRNTTVPKLSFNSFSTSAT